MTNTIIAVISRGSPNVECIRAVGQKDAAVFFTIGLKEETPLSIMIIIVSP